MLDDMVEIDIPSDMIDNLVERIVDDFIS